MLQPRSLLAASFTEWWDNFYQTHFSTSGDYENLGISDGGIMSLESIVIGIAVGFFIASCMAIFNRRVLGDFVRQVLSSECHSPESAKTLEELGYHKNAFIRGSLKGGVSLRRVIKCVEEEAFYAEVAKKRAEFEAKHANSQGKAPKFREPKFEVPLLSRHYYIPEELKYIADVKFEKKGTNWIVLVLAFVLFAAIAVGFLLAVPELLQMLDNMIGMFDWRSDVLT